MADNDAPFPASSRSQPAALDDPAPSIGNTTARGSPRRFFTDDDHWAAPFFCPRGNSILTGSIMDEDEPTLQSDRPGRTSR